MNAHAAGIATLLVLDFAWLYFYMSNRYRHLILAVQRGEMKVNMYAAAAAYLFMVLGLYLFVTKPLLQQKSSTPLAAAFLQGFPFGAILYGVYNATNLSVLSRWDVSLALLDTLWGGFVYSAAAYVSLL